MVVDASVLIGILYDEPGSAESVALLSAAPDVVVAAPTVLEASIVHGATVGFDADHVGELIRRLAIEIVPFDAEQAAEARLAYARFGKGRHPARLNFGDCISYALARVRGQPLAYRGHDFGRTDITGIDLSR